MKHRRGIDLAPFAPSEYAPHDTASYRTLYDLQEWEVVGAKCGKCGRTTWLNKDTLKREIGTRYLRELQEKLLCRCGNREGNRVMIGKLPR